MKKKFQLLVTKYPKLKSLSNKYIIAIFLFGIWMLFLDNYSVLDHANLNAEIKTLQTNQKYYINEINKDQKQIDELRKSEKLEGYAREKYFMKRPNEDIYIIEFENETP
ncbi:septum formation initiator family protein [Flavobacterium agricola]|uniref:Septum formation initiator family protein n=1 Tax=Flavobacterium agricola TaxID=2870839 RepID=A0ABY6LVV7_9FLAO|nr:septum formation initiator family protein [Flavobacterium agricola]UYW00314.1 septum formation initiator family protein [Flavobacterium agricola]